MKCKYCNEELSDSVKYCPNCGAETGRYEGGMPGVGETPPPQKPIDYSSWDARDEKEEKSHGGWTPVTDGGFSSSSGGSVFGEKESPCYVNFVEAIKLYFKNYVNFNGRSTRSEYWFAFLFTYLLSNAASIIDREIGFYALSIIVGLGTFLPSMSIAFRRLHDIGKSGLTYLIGFIITVVWLVLLFSALFSCLGGSLDPNVIAKANISNDDLANLGLTMLGGLIPFAFGIYMIVLFAKPSQITDNAYGRAPK